MASLLLYRVACPAVSQVCLPVENLLLSPPVTRRVNLLAFHLGNLVAHLAHFPQGFLHLVLLLDPPVCRQENQLHSQHLQPVIHLANHRPCPVASLPVAPVASLAVIPPLLPRLRPPSRQVFPPRHTSPPQCQLPAVQLLSHQARKMSSFVCLVMCRWGRLKILFFTTPRPSRR